MPHPGVYRTWLILNGGTSLVFSMIVTANLIYQVEVARLNPLQLTLVGTVLEATAFVCQVPTGALADAWSRRGAIILGVFLTGAGFFVEGLFPHFGVILLAQVISGAGVTLMDGADAAWIAGELGEEQTTHAFLRGSQVGQITGVIGVIAGAALGSLRINAPVVLGGALDMLLALALLWLMPRERSYRRITGGSPKRITWRAIGATMREGYRAARRDRVLLLLLAVALCFGMASEGYDRLWTPHLLENFQFPSFITLKPVVWLAAIGLAGTPLTFATTELVRRHFAAGSAKTLPRVLLLLTALRIVSVAAVGLAGSFAFVALASWGASISRNVAEPVYRAWLTRASDTRVRATVLSLSGQMDALGQIAGGPVIGAVGTFASLRAAIALSAAALLPSLPLFARHTPETVSEPVSVVTGE
jgi:DHA3 family tetracycline resistance protein-like MFS transporter